MQLQSYVPSSQAVLRKLVETTTKDLAAKRNKQKYSAFEHLFSFHFNYHTYCCVPLETSHGNRKKVEVGRDFSRSPTPTLLLKAMSTTASWSGLCPDRF